MYSVYLDFLILVFTDLDDMLSLKEAVARDNEASDFVIKLAQAKDGSKQVMEKMQDGGANI